MDLHGYRQYQPHALSINYITYNRVSTSFWKDVRKMASTKIPLATKVRDAIGTADITALWQTHYSELLNSVHHTSLKSLFVNMLMLYCRILEFV